MNDKPCIRCGSTDRHAPAKVKKIGDCKACKAKRDAGPEARAREAARRARPEVKAKRAALTATLSAERDAYRNFLLLSMGVTDLSQDYDFHHVIGRKVTGHDTIGTLLRSRGTWEQAWTEAHTLTVVMTKADHKEYHRTHKMQEDGTFAVRWVAEHQLPSRQRKQLTGSRKQCTPSN